MALLVSMAIQTTPPRSRARPYRPLDRPKDTTHPSPAINPAPRPAHCLRPCARGRSREARERSPRDASGWLREPEGAQTESQESAGAARLVPSPRDYQHRTGYLKRLTLIEDQ